MTTTKTVSLTDYFAPGGILDQQKAARDGVTRTGDVALDTSVGAPTKRPCQISTVFAYRDDYYTNYKAFPARPPEQPGREIVELEQRVFEGSSAWVEGGEVRLVNSLDDLYRGGQPIGIIDADAKNHETQRSTTSARPRPSSARSTKPDVQLLDRLPRHDFSLSGRAWFEDITRRSHGPSTTSTDRSSRPAVTWSSTPTIQHGSSARQAQAPAPNTPTAPSGSDPRR